MQTNRRSFLKTIGAGALLAATTRLTGADTPTAKPNIVLCMADDQGWGDMAYYGHKVLKTPNFDAMAAETLRFDRFYAAAPVCSPTRASVITGRHPNRMGVFKWGHPIRPQETTIAEALKTAGYVTGHFGKWHLGSVYKNSPANPTACGFDQWLSAPNFYDNDAVMSREGKAVQTKGESSMIAVDAAIEFMGKHARNAAKPFLAVVWFGSPHSPHIAAEADRTLYADQGRKSNFLGEITGMDRAFGKLRKAIATLGVRDNTILWYCSDNGGLRGLGATGGRANKGSVYEGGLRVPAILEWPARIKAPRVTAVPCNTSDIYPTLLEIVGVKVPDAKQPPLDGISLVDLIDGKMTTRAKPMGFWDYPAGGISTRSTTLMANLLKLQADGKEVTDPGALRISDAKVTKQYPEDTFPGHSAWLDWPWKLHRIEGRGKPKPQKPRKRKPAPKGKAPGEPPTPGKPRLELYNLATDPNEATNQAATHPDRVKTMTAALETWLASVVRSLNGKDYT